MTTCLKKEANQLRLRIRCHSPPSIVRIRSPYLYGTIARPAVSAMLFRATPPIISMGRRSHLRIRALLQGLLQGPSPTLDSSYPPVLLACLRLSSLIVSATPLMFWNIVWNRPITGDVLFFSNSCAKHLIASTTLNVLYLFQTGPPVQKPSIGPIEA